MLSWIKVNILETQYRIEREVFIGKIISAEKDIAVEFICKEFPLIAGSIVIINGIKGLVYSIQTSGNKHSFFFVGKDEEVSPLLVHLNYVACIEIIGNVQESEYITISQEAKIRKLLFVKYGKHMGKLIGEYVYTPVLMNHVDANLLIEDLGENDPNLDENYYRYVSEKNNQCIICGKEGRSRGLYCLCERHNDEFESLGFDKFEEVHKLRVKSANTASVGGYEDY